VNTSLKILKVKLNKGIVKVLPESLDDIWHLYNIILKNDEVYGRTTREVKVEDRYARPQRGKRVSVLLGVKVEKVSWDRSLNRLRVHGIVCRAPEDLNVKGSHHTINVIPNNPITIVKSKWLRHEIDRVKRASKTATAPIIVASIDDEGYCVAVLRQYGIDVKVETKTKLPGKFEPEKRIQATREIFKDALKVLRQAWMKLRSPIVIIGLGFTKAHFARFVRDHDSEIAAAIIDIKGVNSVGVAGIDEALRSGIFTKAIQQVRIAEEAKVMEEVLLRLGKGSMDATYGFDEVKNASTMGAVDELLIADVTLREASNDKRILLETLIRDVEEKRGKIMVLSVEHEAGAKLLSLGGIAALLRFPIA
jgi:protein pelota